MIARLPPNALVSPDDFMMPRITNCLSPSAVLSGSRLPDVEMILVRELLGHDQRIGLGEKDQRVVDDRLVAAVEVVVAKAAIAGHVDAEDEHVAFAG